MGKSNQHMLFFMVPRLRQYNIRTKNIMEILQKHNVHYNIITEVALMEQQHCGLQNKIV